ncbi:MAG: glycosyltransferase family 39 protein, partial [Chloroflexota bacterium]
GTIRPCTRKLPMKASSRPTTYRHALAMMVGVLLLASLFYSYNLDAVSFWEDESWMAIGIDDGLVDVWVHATDNGVHPPLYFYIAFFLKPLIGLSEFALRWMGGLITIIGIAFTYRLGATITGDRRAGVIAALFATGAIYLIYLARLARQYTLFYTLSAMTYWIYWRWYSRPSRDWLVALCLVQTANLYTHYFAAFVAVGIGLHALTTKPLQQSWRVIASFVGSGLLFLPWLPSILVQLDSDLGEGVYYGASRLRDIPENYIGRITNANSWFGLGFLFTSVVAIWQNKQWRFLWLTLLVVIGTFIPIVVINQTLFQWYIGRNMLYTLPIVAVFFGVGLSFVSRTWLGKISTLAFMTGFIVWGLLAYNAFYPDTTDWRGVMRSVANTARPDDVFVLHGEPYSADYYLRRYLDTRVTWIQMDDWLANPTYGNRIWLIDDGQSIRDEALATLPDDMLQTERIVRLPVVAEFYQQAPTEPTATFGEQLAVAITETPTDITAGQTVTLDLWWQAIRTPDFNYSASVQLWQNGVPIAQVDGNFDSGQLDAQVLPVGIWTPDTRTFTLPDTLTDDPITVYVTVYDWRDNTRLPVEPPADNNLHLLATINP